jgi:peroxiredoxin
LRSLENEPELLVGLKAPVFTLLDVNGNQISVDESTFSNIYTLLFVSSRCQICNYTMSNLDYYAKRTKSNLIIVCYGTSQEVARMQKDFSIKYPMLIDTSAEVCHTYNVNNFPVAFQVNHENIITSVGRESYPQFEITT